MSEANQQPSAAVLEAARAAAEKILPICASMLPKSFAREVKVQKLAAIILTEYAGLKATSDALLAACEAMMGEFDALEGRGQICVPSLRASEDMRAAIALAKKE